MTWGTMITPSLATAAATIAICSGVAFTSFWPMPVWASAGVFSRIGTGGSPSVTPTCAPKSVG